MSLPQIVKRTFDVFLAMVLLTVLSPILCCSALLLLLTEGRPLFYVSKRYVSPVRSISVIKFRSMARDAQSEKYDLVGRFMRDGYLDIPINCEVYTRMGRWLERLQIVELPQLLNILFDGMSFIGNRPLPADNLQRLSKFPHWRERFTSPAGISGMAQVVGKMALAPEERLALEIAYSKLYCNGGVLQCDFLIFLCTLRLIALGKGISLTKAREMVGLSTEEWASLVTTPQLRHLSDGGVNAPPLSAFATPLQVNEPSAAVVGSTKDSVGELVEKRVFAATSDHME